MSKRKLLAPIAAAVAGLVLALSAGVVITAPDTALPWSVFGAGGNSSSSTNYALGSTSGQTSPIGESTGTNYNLGAGFWAGIACPNDDDGLTSVEEAGLGTDRCLADTDRDGCADVRENGPDERQGGRRSAANSWDYFNPTGDRRNRIDDVLLVIAEYRNDDPPNTDYVDRTYEGPDPWDLGPPDGRIRIGDVLNIIAQYRHDCP